MDTYVCVRVCACVYVIYIYLYVYIYICIYIYIHIFICMCIRRKNRRSRIPRDFDARKRFQSAFPREATRPRGRTGTKSIPLPHFRDFLTRDAYFTRYLVPRNLLVPPLFLRRAISSEATRSFVLGTERSDSSEMMPLDLCESESRQAYRFSCHLHVFVSIIATCKTFAGRLMIDLGGIFLNAILKAGKVRGRGETGSRVDMYTSRSSRIRSSHLAL